MRKDFTGSISTLLSAYPVRLFPGVVLISIYIYTTSNHYGNILINQIRYQVILGITMGVIFIQQQDFGIASVIATIATMCVARHDKSLNKSRNIRNILLFSLSSLSFFILVMQVIGKPIEWSYFAFFNRQFSGGFGAELIELPGPALLVIPLICALLAFHFKNARDFDRNDFEKNSTLIGLVSILWVLFAFPYYLNRSFASGQLQIFLGLIGLSLISLIGRFEENLEEQKNTRNYFNLDIESLFVRSFLAFPLALVILLPNPVIDGYRIYKGFEEARFAKKTTTEDIPAIKLIIKELSTNQKTDKLGYFGNLGNYVEIETGAKSTNLFNNPRDLTISKSSKSLGCAYLRRNSKEYMYFDDTALYYLQLIGNSNCLPSIELNQNQNLYHLVNRNP